MNLGHVFQESELAKHINTNLFQCTLQCGKEEFQHKLQTTFTGSKERLEARAEHVLRIRRNYSIRPSYVEYDDCVKDEKILKDYKSTPESKTGEQAVFFTGEHTKPLNQIPLFLTVCVFLKLYIAPFMGLLTPLLLFVMPYFIMKYTMGMDIPWKIYYPMMKSMLLGIQEGETWTLKHFAQVGWTLASLGQSMVQPCLTAYQTRQVDALILQRGNALIRFVERGANILAWLQSIQSMPPSAQFPEIPKDPRRAAAWMDEEPLAMAHIWKLWGEMDIYFTLAKDVRWKTIDWSHPSLDLTNIYDLAIPETTAIQSTLGLKKHSLFTGPNRGGKSSTLRAILQQILLGQTFGFTFGETTHGAWTPFKYIFTRLKSRDSSGKESLFEMEVRMASTILKTLRKQSSHTLVLIDELFHSTNPPDAETSARLFLQQLWTFPQAKSIISTHIFSLCESCPTDIETFCCSAIEHDDTSIEYSYMLSKGVCRVSSVREVLAEHEILRLNTS